MSGIRLFAFMVCAFGATSVLLPWAAHGLLAGSEESGFRLRFGIVSLLGFIGAMAALHATRSARSSATIRAVCATLGGLILLVDICFALVAEPVWRTAAESDYVYYVDESARPAIGWYLSLVCGVLLVGCAIVRRPWASLTRS